MTTGERWTVKHQLDDRNICRSRLLSFDNDEQPHTQHWVESDGGFGWAQTGMRHIKTPGRQPIHSITGFWGFKVGFHSANQMLRVQGNSRRSRLPFDQIGRHWPSTLSVRQAGFYARESHEFAPHKPGLSPDILAV